jgi:hypothetical protein
LSRISLITLIVSNDFATLVLFFSIIKNFFWCSYLDQLITML